MSEAIHNGNRYAFPGPHEGPGGFTKREYLAAIAMQGLLANPGGPIQRNGNTGWGLTNVTWEQVAGVAGRAADALLAELAKPAETPLDADGRPVK